MHHNLFSKPNRSLNWPIWLPTPGNIIFTLLIASLLIMSQSVWSAEALQNTPNASSSTINYQGRLADSSGNALSGSYNLQFSIYDADSGGNRIWGSESHTGVSVNNGLFSVGLGSQTEGGIPATTWSGDRYLEISVNGESLTPRELVRSVPIAGMALTVPDRAIESRHVQLTSGILVADIPGSERTFELTSEFQTVPGTTFTLAPDTDQSYLIYVTTDLKTNNAVAVSQLFVDESSVGSLAIFAGNSSGIFERGTVSQTYLVHLSAGTHTLELRARLDSGLGAWVYEHHTNITYIGFSQ